MKDQASSGPVMFAKPHPGAGSRSSSSRRKWRPSMPPLAGAGTCESTGITFRNLPV